MFLSRSMCVVIVLVWLQSSVPADEFLGDDIVDRNAAKICERSTAMQPDARYEFLADWVLNDAIRLSWATTAKPADHDHALACPAADLVKVAQRIGKLTELKDRIAAYPVVTNAQKATSAALLLHLELTAGNSSAAVQHAKDLDASIGGTLVAPALQQPYLFAAWFARSAQPTKNVLGSMLRDEHSLLLQSRQDRIDHRWGVWIAGLSGLYDHLDSGQPESVFGDPPRRKNWFPTTVATEQTQFDSLLPTHWKSFASQVECLSAQDQNLLFYRLPLLGDFEVSCETTDYAFQQIHLMYGGEWIVPKQYRATFGSGNLRDKQNNRLAAALKDPQSWVRYKLIVRQNTCSIWVNGRKIHERQLSTIHDPWLAIRCATPFHGAIRSLRILGSPDVPETVSLISSTGLQGWVPWFRERVGSGPAAWGTQSGDGAGPVLVGRRRNELRGTQAESLLTYQRPLAEDGVLSYEFFYTPDAQHAHPALGRTAFLFRSHGVQVHDVGRPQQPGDTHADEQIFPAEISDLLAANRWNTVRLKLTGDFVQISLNEQPVGQFNLSANNPRTFGMFYFPDQAQLLVRKLHWQGRWSTSLPDVWHQELAGDDLKLVDETRRQLPAVFTHDFATDGLSEEYFTTNTSGDGSATETSEGVATTISSPTGYKTTKLQPRFEIHGDFDITASFDSFAGAGNKEKSARIQALIGGEDFSTAITHQTDAKTHFKGLRIYTQPDGKRKSQMNRVDSEAFSGRLRLARIGENITFAFAERSSNDFHLIRNQQASSGLIGHEDLDLRSFAGPGSQASVVWTHVEIRAEKLVYDPPAGTYGRKGLYVLTLPEKKPADDEIPQWRQYCEKQMQAYQLSAFDADGDPVVQMKQPIMVHRHSEYSKGLVYLWLQKDGRPAAIGTAMVQGNIESGIGLQEIDEFHSLHDRAINMTLDDKSIWELNRPGLQWHKLPGAPQPADNVTELYAQAQNLSLRFSIQVGARGRPGLPLREKPIYEYSFTSQNRLCAGVLTAFVDAADPEVLLNLQVRTTDDGKFRWHYAGANYGYTSFLLLDGKEVWNESPAKFAKTHVHRGWKPNRNLNLEEALANRMRGAVAKAFDIPKDMRELGAPKWASDGKSLVFHGDRFAAGSTETVLLRINLKTNTLAEIGAGSSPSPDGEKIIFSRRGSGIMQANSDGTDEEQLDENGGAAEYSPDGKYVAWGTESNIIVMDRSTGQQRQILTPQQSAQIRLVSANVSWSPDSQAVAFLATRSESDEQMLVVADIDSSDSFKVLFTGDIQPDLTWHPDSQRIVFASAEPDSRRLYIINRHNDTVPHLLQGAPVDYRIYDCHFSPDGTQIAFSAQAPAVRVEWTSKSVSTP